MDEVAVEAGETIKTIRKRLAEITGRELKSYADVSNVHKVIKTLFLIMRLRGQDRIFGLIKEPESIDEARFEFRDAFPNAENTKNTWILADLKAQLAAEMESQTLDKIDCLFDDLINRADRARNLLDAAAYRQRDYARTISVYKALRDHIDGFVVTVQKFANLSLDEDLYLHLNRTEFLNYAGEYQIILTAARPPAKIVPAVEELTQICLAMERLHGWRPVEYEAFVPLSELSPFVEEFMAEILRLITAATALEFDAEKCRSLIPYAEELLLRVDRFGRGEPLPKEATKVNIRSIAAALCAVAGQEIEGKTEYRPTWFGHSYQGSSLIAKLSIHVFNGGDAQKYEIPEGFFQLWHNRFDWIRDLLCNHAEIAEQKFELRKCLFSKLSECVKVNGIEAIEHVLEAFDNHVLDGCANVSSISGVPVPLAFANCDQPYL